MTTKIHKSGAYVRLEILNKWATRLQDAASEVKFAEKPADLTYPYSVILEIAREVLQFRDYWMIQK